MEKKNIWLKYSEKETAHLEKLNAGYREFLDAGKTERECVKEIVEMAEKAGYRELSEATQPLKQGDKIYVSWMIVPDRK